MQMLESFFGPQFGRFASFLVIAIALLILILVVWWLIRKTMGDRLNMSDKPDRRGRPPRLGITESFAVDRQGRRLVMVRRDNVEHLVMIGGPNDVVIETNVVRGERPVVGRPDLRNVEPELAFAPSQVETPPPAPFVAPAPVVVPAPVQAQAPKPIVAAPPAPPMPTPLPKPAAQPAVVDLPKAPVAERPIVEPTPQSPAPRAGTSFADRIKAGLSFGSPSADITKVAEAAKVMPVEAKAAEVKAAVEAKAAVVETKIAAVEVKAAAVVAPPPPPPPAPPPPPPPPPPAPAPAPTEPPKVSAPKVEPAKFVEPPKVEAPKEAPAKAAPPAVKPVSKNPFDSLEEEMAKLLGRAPDGKG